MYIDQRPGVCNTRVYLMPDDHADFRRMANKSHWTRWERQYAVNLLRDIADAAAAPMHPQGRPIALDLGTVPPPIAAACLATARAGRWTFEQKALARSFVHLAAYRAVKVH
jgi:hypothetical protein